MPAMSPTMTEGNIASWKVKEGDSFSTGDVLLEIETDKAQMDVEAQEDGKMVKISQQTGAKGVKVGARIAVLAEIDDDLSRISLPDEPQSSFSQDTSESPESKAASKEQDAPPIKPTNPSSSSSSTPSSAKTQKQTYPLYPSIAQLLREKGLSLSSADNIPASGPKGRLLKGDVLAYLGQINNSYSSEQSARIRKLGQLDLSSVKAAPAKEMVKPPSQPAPTPEAVEPLDTEIAVPISLAAVISVQKRMQDTLGVTLPLSNFLARATELANEDLPRSNAAPTADQLFNNVLGLHNVSSKVSRGDYIPQVTALPSRPMSSERVAPKRKVEEADVYDFLTGNSTLPSSRTTGVPSAGIMGGSKVGDSTNVFSVSAAKGEEKRVRTFLERVKTILQVEPGRLIL